MSFRDGYLKNLTSSNLFSNLAKVFGGDILSRVIGLGTTIFIIRGLSVNDYASYVVFYSIVILCSGLVGTGINRALINFTAEEISRTGEKPYEIYLISLLFQIFLYFLLSVFVFLFMDIVNNLLFGQKDFEGPIRYGLIAGFGFLIVEAGKCIFLAEEKFGQYVKTLWFRQVSIFGLIFLLFLLNQLDFERSAQVVIIAQLSVGFIILIYIFRGVNLREISRSFTENREFVSSFFLSVKWLLGYYFVLMLFYKIDVFMLSHYASTEELAFYGIAIRYYALILMLRGSIQSVLLPKFSKVDMHDIQRQRQFTLKWLKATAWLIVPIAIADIFGKPLFVLVNGIQYERAFDIFVILSIGILISLMFSPLVNVLIARKSFKFLFVLGVTAFFVCLVGNYLVVPLWGGIGAAVITVLTHGMINLASGVRIFYSNT